MSRELIEALPHDTWIDAEWHKPPKNRKVLAIFEDDHLAEVKWNGMYWVGQYNMKLMRTEKVVAFLIHEIYHKEEVMQ